MIADPPADLAGLALWSVDAIEAWEYEATARQAHGRCIEQHRTEGLIR